MQHVSGWGRNFFVEANVKRFKKGSAQTSAPITPRGMGRSYGDAACGHHVLDMTGHNLFLAFNPETGVLKASAGVTLDHLLQVFLPKGWFVPVTPGTRFVTLGGCVAADVHGKNHHAQGCFSAFVQEIDVQLASGECVSASSTQQADLFYATCGGMGLTGIITTVTLRLQKVSSAFMDQVFSVHHSLEALANAFEQHEAWPYSVAWVDLSKPDMRGHLMLGQHAAEGGLERSHETVISMPVSLPFNPFLKPINTLAQTALFTKGRFKKTQQKIGIVPYFYPLDGVLGWNKMYGPKGFVQYQCVVPNTQALKAVHEAIYQSAEVPTLAVLKRMGPANQNLLSFPMAGYTLAVDFPVSASLPALIERLDAIVLEAGGRVYLAKDSFLNTQKFRQFYPSWENFQNIRQHYGAVGHFSSLLAQRIGLEKEA